MKSTFFLVAIGVMATAGMARAESYTTEQLCQVLQPCLPPAQYASGPFIAKPVVRQVTLRQLQSACGGGYAALLGDKYRPESIQAVVSSGANFGALGCAQLTSGECVVHVPSDLKAVLPGLYRLVLNHELAHCRGWVHQRY